MFENLIPLIETIGYFGVFGMLFAETGLLVGVVFPGDTLLFSVGLLAAEGYFNLPAIIAGATLAAIIGDSVGYWTGQRLGPKIFTKEDSLFFKKSYVMRAETFFQKHGVKTIILARYIPIVRTFAPVVAGVAGMEYKKFITYNVIGGILWCVSVTLLGYFLGTKIPSIDQYILPIIGAVFILSFVPFVIEYVRAKWKR